MATRFYLPSSGSPVVTPGSIGAGWRSGSWTLGIFPMSPTPGSTAYTTAGSAGDGTPGVILLGRWVSAALAAQTLSGTIQGTIRCAETHDACNALLAIRVGLCDSGGGNIREVLAITFSSGSARPPEFVVTTLTNRRLEVDNIDDFILDLTSTGVNDNDSVFVEIGADTSTGNFTGTRFPSMEVGENSGSDLAADETGTTQNRPWIEFSHNFTFFSGTPVFGVVEYRDHRDYPKVVSY